MNSSLVLHQCAISSSHVVRRNSIPRLSSGIPKALLPLLSKQRSSTRIKSSENDPTDTTPPAADDTNQAPDDDIIPASEQNATADDIQHHSLTEDQSIASDTIQTTIPSIPEGLLPKTQQFIRDNPIVGYSGLGIAAFLSITFVIAVVRTAARSFSRDGKRSRTINKNKAVIDELSKFLPDNRNGLSKAAITTLRFRTGFSPVEIFRKYLWYLLRERKFDNDAVADVVALRTALDLTEQDVATALKERAQRVYEKYGNVMLDTTGMSPAGIERKATARSLFSKMLYLVECEDLIASPEEQSLVNLRDIFGATEDDVARLRIASLYDVDLDKALELPSSMPSSTSSASSPPQEESEE